MLDLRPMYRRWIGASVSLSLLVCLIWPFMEIAKGDTGSILNGQDNVCMIVFLLLCIGTAIALTLRLRVWGALLVVARNFCDRSFLLERQNEFFTAPSAGSPPLLFLRI